MQLALQLSATAATRDWLTLASILPLVTVFGAMLAEIPADIVRQQIVEWLCADFDGVIIFDESHAMQNAAGGRGERGDQAASQQIRAGLRLQHVCRTRASFMSRRPVPAPFITLPMSNASGSGVARAFRSRRVKNSSRRSRPEASRRWRYWRATSKRSALYAARSLSYERIEYELIEHQLTDKQIRIYDAMLVPSQSSITVSTLRCGQQTSPAQTAR